MKKTVYIILILLLILLPEFTFAEVTVKLRDISYIEGLKDNQVFGYGLVVGLQGTGDTKTALTRSTMKNLLKNLGLELDEEFNSKNIAAVLITGRLAPFVRVGDRVDVTISSIGDAKSLEGGILVQSPLKGADNQIYVAVQGPLSFGSLEKGGRDVKTVAHISGGGIVERAIEPEFVVKDSIHLVLSVWDFSLANKVMKKIAELIPETKPEIVKGGRIRITVAKKEAVADIISKIENIEVAPSFPARVVVHEKDGTIVMGGDVKISEVLVSKDGITVKVKGSSEKAHVAHLKESATVKDLVETLNYIGASTRDIISILKALKDAGALHAELIVK